MVKDVKSKKYTSIFQITREWQEFHGLELVPFGEITDEPSLKTLKTLLSVPPNENKKPKFPIVIYECGEM